MPSFEIQADIFTSLRSIWRAFRRVKYRKMPKISASISEDVPNNIFVVKLKNFTPGVKILEFRFNKKIEDFLESKNL